VDRKKKEPFFFSIQKRRLRLLKVELRMTSLTMTLGSSVQPRTSPIKRSAACAELSGWSAPRPGKISRLDLTGRSEGNHLYGTTLQHSTGARMQFRPTQSPVTVGSSMGTPVLSQTHVDQSRGTPPREPKPLFGESKYNNDVIRKQQQQQQQHQQQPASQMYKMTMQPFQQQGFAGRHLPSNIGGKGFFSNSSFGSTVGNRQFPHSTLHAFHRTGSTNDTTMQQQQHQQQHQQHHQYQQHVSSPPQRIYHMESSGVSPALKALNFSPALRPSSPPSVVFPTLEGSLDDNAMLDGDIKMSDDGEYGNDAAMDSDNEDDYHQQSPNEYSQHQQSSPHQHQQQSMFRVTPSPVASPFNNMSPRVRQVGEWPSSSSASASASSSSSTSPVFSRRPSSRSSSMSIPTNSNTLLQRVLRPQSMVRMIRSHSFESTMECGTFSSRSESPTTSRPGTPFKQGSSILWNFRQASPTRTDSRASNKSVLSMGSDSGGGATMSIKNENVWSSQPDVSPVLTSSFPETPTPSETSSVAVR
jgi:hypothetical protein